MPLLEKKVKDWTIEDINQEIERIEIQKSKTERIIGRSIK